MTVHVSSYGDLLKRAKELKREITAFEKDLKRQAKAKVGLIEKYQEKKKKRIENYRKHLADIEAAIQKIEDDAASPPPNKTT
jgi:peptidoglycan hydrolase CwlO-like protein